jgi:hypothetical protein
MDLDTNLSTTTAGSEAQPDKDLGPLALPIPNVTRTSEGKWRVLPGAPLAFCEGGIDGYADTLTLEDWCREHCDFSSSIAHDVQVYFSERAAHIRSFVSLPLTRFDEESSVIGILNIHRSEPGLLNEKKPAEQFEPLVAPFHGILLQLLDMLKKC